MKPLHATEAPLVGTSLVEASAGTGKTHTITTLYLRLVLERGLSVREIVVVTFTEAATSELRGRIRRRLREAQIAMEDPARAVDDDLRAIVRGAADPAEAKRRIRVAISELDMARISTIHAFSLRALTERAFESGARFDVALATDTSELAREISEDYWSRTMVPLPRDLFLLVRGDLELGTIRRLVDTFARRPADLPVLPEVAVPDLDALRRELHAAWARAKATWAVRRAAVRKILVATKAVTKRQSDGYNEENLGVWFEQLDDLFAGESASFTLPPAVERFSTSGLASSVIRKNQPPTNPFFDDAEALLDVARRAAKGLALGLKCELVRHVRTEMARRKAALGIQGFEDLLFGLDAALRRDGGARLASALREELKAALIDEFQDTDPVQFRIFQRIFHGEATLILVGDPKQSIYAFRGADVFSYFQAGTDAGEARYTLDTNHRSDPSLVRAVNTIFDRVPKPFVFDDIAFHGVLAHAKKDRITLAEGAALEILFLPRRPGEKPHGKGVLAETLPDLVAAEIVRFLASGARIEGRTVRPGDVAVLTRTNEQASLVQIALRRLGIPTALESQSSVFQSAEATELEQVLRAVLEPTRATLLRAALATSIVGRSAGEIAGLEADERGWQAWSERFRRIQEIWARHGFMPACHEIMDDFGVQPRLLAYVDGERRVTNLVHLGDVLHAAALRERLGPSGLVRWLGAMRAAPDDEPGLLSGEAGELRLESDALAVKLLTIHKSKGLEYPIVYCPQLWDSSPREEKICLAFHDPADGHRLKMHLAPKDAPAATEAATRESKAELQRLLYVALTRARHRCSIVWGSINQTEDSALAYTLHPHRDDVTDVEDKVLRADLEALRRASAETISIRDLVPGEAPAYAPGELAGEALAARPYDRRVDTRWRIGSFSGMTSGPTASAPEAEGRDRDEVDEPEVAGAPSSGGPVEEGGAPVVLRDFPRGTRAGLLLHAILEDHDFMDRDRDALAALVRGKLTAFGFDPGGLEAPLLQGIDAVLDTPLGIGMRLRDLPRSRRVDELEFLLPVAQEREAHASPRALARAFEEHGSDRVPDAWVARLKALRSGALRGYLRGFVDLVFEHEGKYFVVDYKSNHLGDTAASYAPARLVAPMAHAHYFLQYHLYTVAVHRWLARRMRGYDYERSFGGVLYLFARGMAPGHPEGSGIFFDRPRRALVEALSGVLAHG